MLGKLLCCPWRINTGLVKEPNGQLIHDLGEKKWGHTGDTSAGENGRMELQGIKSQGWVIDWILRLQKGWIQKTSNFLSQKMCEQFTKIEYREMGAHQYQRPVWSKIIDNYDWIHQMKVKLSLERAFGGEWVPQLPAKLLGRRRCCVHSLWPVHSLIYPSLHCNLASC